MPPQQKKDGDEVISNGGKSNILETKWSEGEVIFELNSQIKDIQITDISPIINTEVVAVTANNISDDMEIALYFYNAEDEINPMM